MVVLQVELEECVKYTITRMVMLLFFFFALNTPSFSCPVRPDPPEQVRVMETGRNWLVSWIDPNRQSKFQVCNQLCYYRKREEVRKHVAQ